MIQTSISSIVYVGNASTVTPYPVPFYFFADEDLVVNSIDSLGSSTLLQLGTDYVVTGAGDYNGGSVTTSFAVPINWHLTIKRILAATQLTSYNEGDAFPAKSHERALDKLTMLVQQQQNAGGNGGGGQGGGGKAWEDESARILTTPNFIGQLGFQIDTATIYYARSLMTGDWAKGIFDNSSSEPGQVPIFTTDARLSNIVIDGVATLTSGVLGAVAKPAGELVGTTAVQTLTNKTLTSPVINSPTGILPVDVGLGNVDNVSDANAPISNATAVALAEKEDKINKGQLGGYASLDATGKVPVQEMPASVLGANVYQGTWNASTNTPTIPPAAPGNQGFYWVVAVAGSTNIDGTSTWAPGDWIISNGVIWQRIANIDSVSSVNSKTGAVVINKTDVGLSNVDNTSDATKNAATVTLTNKTLTAPVINSPTGITKADVGLSAVDNTSDAAKNAATATLTNKTIDGANNTLRVRLDTTDVVNNLPVARLNGGTGAGTTTFWRGDGQWISPPGGGDVTGPTGAINNEMALFSGTTGKLLSRATGTGYVTVVNGVWQTPTIGVMQRGHLWGLRLTNNATDAANDIDIAVGEARDSTNVADIVLAGALTKRLNAAWVVGTNQGGLDTGTIADGTWHVFVIKHGTTGVVDVLFSASATAPTMPSGYTRFRRVGSIIRASSAILKFIQWGDMFTTGESVAYNAGSARAYSLLTLPCIPLGIVVRPILHVYCANSSQGDVAAYLGSANDAQSDAKTLLKAYAVNTYNNNTVSNVITNTSAQVNFSVTIGGGAGISAMVVLVEGWMDQRGQDL